MRFLMVGTRGKQTTRRIFLKGLGGACVAAPFLGSLNGRGLKAQSGAAPRRLIAMFTHYGCITTRWFPQKSHGALTADDLTPTSLKPLVPYVNKLLMPRGIRGMNEWNGYMTKGQGNDPHTQVVGSYFTCQPVTPNSNDPFSFDSATKFNAKPVGPSLDHVIAQQLSPGGTPILIRVAGQSDSPQSAISYSAPETAYPGYSKAAQLFTDLTGLFGGSSLNQDSYKTARGKSVLDAVKDDLDTLERFDMSQTDRTKLEAWKQLLVETTPVITAQCTQDLADTLGVTQTNVNAYNTGGLGTDVLTTEVAAGLDGADLVSNLAVLAAACNVNPVIFLKYPGSYVFKGLGIATESASLSGRLDNAGMSGTCMPDVLKDLLLVDDFYARKFAHLVGMLDAVAEGDGTLLDDSAAVWFNEMSDGCAHNLNNLPILQAGSMGGYFKTGWAVNVEDGSPTLSTGNSEIFCSTGGSDQVDGFHQASATDPKLANAPINKYYCNLMNALGVKAGADGYPSAGGTQQVTHYGMYDKTEDFIGGGTNPPVIHSPGEYLELKANV